MVYVRIIIHGSSNMREFRGSRNHIAWAHVERFDTVRSTRIIDN